MKETKGKDRHYTQHTLFKGILPAAVVLFAIVAVFFFISGIVNRGGEQLQSNAELALTVTWSGSEYKGTYTGEALNGVPNGEGTFIHEGNEITYTGDWKNGTFNGQGSLTYSDGKWEEGTYKDGKRNGWVRRYDSKSSYKDNIYDNGGKYGVQSEYSKGKLVKETIYANGSSVSEIKKNALKLTGDVIRDKTYVDQYVYVKGKVVFLNEDDGSLFFRIKSDSIGMVTGDYSNTAEERRKQAVMPNMSVGDEVTVYASYNGYVEDMVEEDLDYYGLSCVYLDPVYGEISNTETVSDTSTDTDAETVTNTNIERGSYASIRLNPYSYNGRLVEQSFVTDLSTYDDGILRVLVHDPSNAEEQYFLRIETEDDSLIYPGQTIGVKGYIRGQRKIREFGNDVVLNTEKKEVIKAEYRKYPQIWVNDYQLP